jgi:hypothetical protein
MNRFAFASLIALGVFVNASSAVDIKNIRPSYGPFGATRADAKFLPGDFIFMTYDLEGLALDAKSGKTNYETTLEFLDGAGKVLFKRPNVNEFAPLLGGGRMPGDLQFILGAQQAPGKYSIKLTVNDKIAKDAKAFKYDIEVVPQTFGFVGITAPGLGFPGDFYVVGLGVVNLALDDKKSLPNAEIKVTIFDDKGKAAATPVTYEYPRDLPTDDAGKTLDLKKSNFIPFQHRVYLNRPGRFTVEIQAHDKFGNKKTELRYPLTVLDVNNIIK